MPGSNNKVANLTQQSHTNIFGGFCKVSLLPLTLIFRDIPPVSTAIALTVPTMPGVPC